MTFLNIIAKIRILKKIFYQLSKLLIFKLFFNVSTPAEKCRRFFDFFDIPTPQGVQNCQKIFGTFRQPYISYKKIGLEFWLMLLLVENQGQMKTKSGLLGLNGINYCRWVDSIPFWFNLNHGVAVICQKTAKSENHYIKPAVLDLRTRAL